MIDVPASPIAPKPPIISELEEAFSIFLICKYNINPLKISHSIPAKMAVLKPKIHFRKSLFCLLSFERILSKNP